MTGPVPPTDPAPRPATVVVAFRPKRCGQGRVAGTGGASRGDDRPSEAPLEPTAPSGRVPRVARELALAHRWKGLIDAKVVRDQVALARLVGVPRARVTQVMDLLRLAPDIQEDVLDLPQVERGRTRIREYDLRSITCLPCWTEQRSAWLRF